MTMSLRLALTVVCGCLGVATAADPMPKSSSLPAPLPTKNGVQLAVADGTGPTREDALKAAYAAAVRQVADTFVATELLTGGDDKVLSETIRTAANAVVSEGKELSVAKEGKEWRARVIARVAPLKLLGQLQAAKVPVKEAAAAVDGANEFAKVASRLESEKAAAAWFAFLLRDYPFGCYKAEIVSQEEDKEKTTEKEMVWNVEVCYTIDEAKYQAFAIVLAESCEHLSLKPPVACSAQTMFNSDWQGKSKVWGTYFPDTRSLEKWCNDPSNRATLIRVVTEVKNNTSAGQGSRKPKNDEEYLLAGRAFALPKSVYAVFDQIRVDKPSFMTNISMIESGGKVVAGWNEYWKHMSSAPQPFIDANSDNNSIVIQPSLIRSSYGVSPGSHYAPKFESIFPIRIPLADLRRVAKTEVKIVPRK